MRGRIPLLLLPLAFGTAAAETPAPADVLLLEREAGPGWSVVREAVEDVRTDPDMRRWGVRAKEGRHYTRRAGPGVEVCSVEVWTFGEDRQASNAHMGFSYPDWEIHRESRMLVMLRGMRMTPGQPPRRGVFPDCSSLGQRIRARAKAAGS